MNLKGKHFLTLLDFTPEEITGLIDLAAELKAEGRETLAAEYAQLWEIIVGAAEHCADQLQVLEESLIAMYLAADLLDLDRGAVRKLFYDNAARIIAGA